MTEAIETLRRISPDVVAAAVLGPDGAVDFVSADAALDEVLAPVLTTYSEIAGRVCRELGRGPLTGSVLEGDFGRVLTRELDDGRVLIVVAEHNARLGLLMDDVRAACTQIAKGAAHA